MERQENTQYILSLSYGKDSIACLEAIKQLDYPLDRIVHAEIWATDDIPADLPPMVEFKKYADDIILERYGIEVEHVCAMEKDSNGGGQTYERCFYRQVFSKIYGYRNYGFPLTRASWCKKLKTEAIKRIEKADLRENLLSHSQETEPREKERHRGIPVQSTSALPLIPQTGCYRAIHTDSQFEEGTGVRLSNNDQSTNIYGFPYTAVRGRAGMGWCHQLKMDALKFSKMPREQGAKINTVQYLGIAADEPKRIERHTKKGVVLPLVDIGWDEAYCRKWCEDNNLLSPIYTTATRGGCWFCHNQGVDQLRLLRHDYPDLWALLLKWDSDSPTTFKADGHTVHDYDKRFRLEDEGKLTAGDRKFRWKQVTEEDSEPAS